LIAPVALVGQDFLVDSHLVAEENQLLFFGFKKSEVLISENELESDEPGTDVFGRVDSPEADILSADCLIEIP
jgi:hypothetical protein